MRVLVTGCNGLVGRATVAALRGAGYEVAGTDRAGQADSQLDYVEADLLDAEAASAVSAGADAVVHTAAIAGPTLAPPHTVFRNNVCATFNVCEAAMRADTHLLVNISSVTVVGHTTAKRRSPPKYLPVDEGHPLLPQEAYALSKLLGEHVINAAVAGSELRAISLRPPWVLAPDAYKSEFAAVANARDLMWDYWSYIDVRDLADAVVLALGALAHGRSAHDAFFVAAADNALGAPLRELVSTCFGNAVPLLELEREDASGVSSARARAAIGYVPRHSWRNV